MAKETELIRVSTQTKVLLNDMKIIDAESFDAVINRIIQTKIEDHMQICKETTKIINERYDKVKEGKVLSGKELMERIAQKRGRK